MERIEVSTVTRQFKRTFDEGTLNELGKRTRLCQRERTVTPFRLALSLIEVFASPRVPCIADLHRGFNALCEEGVRYKPFHNQLAKAQHHAVDRIVPRYRGMGDVLLDPDINDTELRARLFAVVSESELREDHTDLAHWTRGDRKARFEKMAERHAALSRFAAPFLARMDFLDEDGASTSPTLEALRAYRELRAAGRRALPPVTTVDFVPGALEPLVRRDGAIDRRRWESALFLKVCDEIRAGNLAIDGAKNFGRFGSFFLPDAQWRRTRDDFWTRTGFPVEPDRAVSQLKARLSDAIDRFLGGVPDNRQVTFDDDGWRLKTDHAEPPDPKRSASLVELRRWVDARRRSIRLADLLIEVENDLRFSAHFLHPGEKQPEADEICVLIAAILAHGCNLGLHTMELPRFSGQVNASALKSFVLFSRDVAECNVA